MKDNLWKGVVSAIVGGLTAYFGVMAVPLAVLLLVMCVDYISGMTKAWITSDLNSKIGLLGIIKKLCYMLVVIAAACVDWLCISGLRAVGIEFEHSYYFGVVVTIWLIINELISILENLSEIGVPLPAFLTKIVRRLKNTVETETDKEV